MGLVRYHWRLLRPGPRGLSGHRFHLTKPVQGAPRRFPNNFWRVIAVFCQSSTSRLADLSFVAISTDLAHRAMFIPDSLSRSEHSELTLRDRADYGLRNPEVYLNISIKPWKRPKPLTSLLFLPSLSYTRDFPSFSPVSETFQVLATGCTTLCATSHGT